MIIRQNTKSCLSSSNNKRQKRELKNQGRGSRRKNGKNGGFGERRTSFSIEIRAIRPSAVVGTRREATLRGEGFAWVLDLRSLDKLLDLGVSPYLRFTLCLRTL